jgi:ribonuclease HII
MATDSVSADPAPAPSPDLFYERRAARRGGTVIAGVDEVGRGPLAGPVVAAAVVLNRRWIPDGLNDSKQLTRDDREQMFDELVAHSTVSVVAAPASMIAELNILWASMWAMRRAVLNLTLRPDYVLIDGNTRPKGMPCTVENVVGGDALSLSIAAASIVAKVTRDRMCEIMHCEEPHFGFDSHKGYSAPPHFRALETHGPGRYHRMDFAPCIEAETRLRTGIMVGPLIPPGWTKPLPKPQLDLFAA